MDASIESRKLRYNEVFTSLSSAISSSGLLTSYRVLQEMLTELKGTGLRYVSVTYILSVVAVVLYYSAPSVNLYVPCRVVPHLKRTEIIHVAVFLKMKVRLP